MSLYTYNTQHERRLQTHIRDVLLPYARAHLTIDHVAYTEWAIEQLLLEALAFVPIADATSFLLPTDPLDALIRHLDSLNLKPYEERITISESAIQFIRTVFSPLPHLFEFRAQQCWLEEGCEYERISKMYRPMSPILTQRARNETPKLGGKEGLASIPWSKLPHLVFESVADEVIVDPPTPDFHDVLDVRCKLDVALQGKIRSLIQAVLRPTPNISGTGDTPRVVDFFRSSSPTPHPSQLKSPPLFARKGRTIQKTKHDKAIDSDGPAMDCIADIAPMLKHASAEVIEEEEGDMPGRHMQVVDQWSIFTISSPPSYRRNSSSSSVVDELWDISPPGSPATSLMAAKMEEIEIPRVHKIGHGRGEPADGDVCMLSTAKSPAFSIPTSDLISPGAFITSVISKNSAPIHDLVIGSQNATATSDHVGLPSNLGSPRLSAANSLLGQAPSTIEEHNNTTKLPVVGEGETGAAVDLDAAISSIYASSCDPMSYILEEKLDEKEVLLMDVPNLPPPPAHPRLYLERMSSLVSTGGAKTIKPDRTNKASGTGIMKLLSPVKGLKPLALSLSWIPFKFGLSIPTHEEVICVADAFRPEDDITGYVDPKTEADIRRLGVSPESIYVDGQSAENVMRGFENLGASPTLESDEGKDEFEYVLTRRERNKLAVNSQDREDGAKFREPLDFQGEGLDMREYDAQRCGHQDCENRSTYDLDPCSYVGTPESGGFFFRMNGSNGVPDDIQGIRYPQVYDCANSLDHVHDSEEVVDVEANKENTANSVNITGSANTIDPDILMDNVGDGVRMPLVSHTSPHTKRRPSEDSIGVSQEENALERASKRRKVEHLLPATAKDLFATFLGLRNKGPIAPLASPQDCPATMPACNSPIHIEPQRSMPDEVTDENTVRLDQWINPTTTHRYMASMALIQKRALVLELLGGACKVALVERYFLGGCDIVLDPDHAVLLAPLLALPAQVEALSDRISAESWRYSDILVVFEAYPSARSSRVSDARSVTLAPYPYSPPIVKAIKKLRRIIGIAEGCGSKNKQCSVFWAFASDVEETAKFVRCFGDEASGKASGSAKGALWDDREWLDDEEKEGESDLASAEGMNPFSAVVMLYEQPLEDIFDMSPQGRVENFGDLIGKGRIGVLNSVIRQRKQDMAMTSEPSVVY